MYKKKLSKNIQMLQPEALTRNFAIDLLLYTVKEW